MDRTRTNIPSDDVMAETENTDPQIITYAERAEDPLYDFLREGQPHKMPEDFHERAHPAALAEVILNLKDPFEFQVGAGAERFCLALAEVKRTQPFACWEQLLAKLAPRASISVMNGPAWQPHILIHGGLAIRNYHRVLAISLDSGTSQSGLDPLGIAADVASVLQRAHNPIEDAHLIHHRPMGIELLQVLPTPFRPVGQTLLFVNNRRLLRGLPVLGQWERWGARAKDRCAYNVTFRLFRDTVCAYQLYRHADAADVLLEHYAISVLDPEEPGEPVSISDRLTPSYAFDEAVGEQIDEILECCEPRDIAFDFRTAMLSSENEWSWRNYLREHLNVMPVLFAREYNRPVPFERDDLSAEAAEEHQGKCREAWAYYFSGSEMSGRNLARSTLGPKGDGAVIAEPVEDFGSYRFRPLDASVPPAPVDIAPQPRHRWGDTGLGIRVTGLPEAQNTARAMCCATAAQVTMIIPHLGLHQHYFANGRHREGNARWFGLASRPQR